MTHQSIMPRDIESLRALADGGILGNSKDFALSLITSFNKHQSLTEKQQYWVNKLIQDAVRADPVAVVGNVSPLTEMFKKAKQHLKWPKVNIAINGTTYQFSLAGDSSKNPGCLYVKRSDAMGWTYIGKITADNQFHMSSEGDGVVDMTNVVEFCEEPLSYAVKHGHVSGNCCFCNKTLTDAKSTSVGYGPVCAKHFGLPYGVGV